MRKTERRAEPISADPPAVRVRDLRQSYGSFEAVKGVSFDIAPGELFALLGTNGAGKTTTIETLEGFRRPAGGEVRVLGADPYNQPPELCDRVNGVLQQSGVFGELTVAETIQLGADLAANPRNTAEIIDMIGLTDKVKVQVRQLSGGQKRRLDLGLAVLTRPEVLFLDEPTTGMDPEGRRDTWEVIETLTSEGTAILLTTHYLEEAERLADRLAIMHRGEIRVEGELHDVLVGWGDRIGFQLPEDVPVTDLPDLPNSTFELRGRRNVTWCEYTVGGTDTLGRAQQALTPLATWAQSENVRLARLEVRSASLEDVFLSIAADDLSQL